LPVRGAQRVKGVRRLPLGIEFGDGQSAGLWGAYRVGQVAPEASR
jgi:hypothetical protein